MTRLELKPNGFPCTLEECPPGPFLHGKDVCFKSEYHSNTGRIEAYCSSGEAYHGTGLIQPLESVWIEEEL